MATIDKVLKVAGRQGALVRPAAILMALRPKQWIKNGLVFLPFLFAIDVAWGTGHLEPVPGLLLRGALVFLSFCALSSAVYVFNDLMDRPADQQHPLKRRRPIASGKVAAPTALALMVGLASSGLVVMALVDPLLGGLGLLYLGINAAYNLGVKRIVLIDVMVVASGYVLRAVAGAVAVDVTPSPWLYATTGAGALFLALGRRYAEVRLTEGAAARWRPVLRKYAGPLAGQMLTVSAAAAWLSYALYTVEADNLPSNGAMLLTLPFVTFGLHRYLYLLKTSEEAEAPEQLITRDLPLVLSIVCWVAASALVLLLSR